MKIFNKVFICVNVKAQIDNHKGWCGGSTLRPLSKRLEVRFPLLVNGKNSVVNFLSLSVLTMKRRISLTTADHGDTSENRKKKNSNR